jgi:hypothetical protein
MTRLHYGALACSFDMLQWPCSSNMAQHCWVASHTGYPNVRRVFGAVWFAIMISRGFVDFRRVSVAV